MPISLADTRPSARAPVAEFLVATYDARCKSRLWQLKLLGLWLYSCIQPRRLLQAWAFRRRCRAIPMPRLRLDLLRCGPDIHATTEAVRLVCESTLQER
jgi:hypothetical protein